MTLSEARADAPPHSESPAPDADLRGAPRAGVLRALRVDVELSTLGDEAFAPKELTPLFHELIREQALDDLLIDVADYSHVPEGPGLVLVGHDAQIHYKDRVGGPEGRRSLVYSRRRESWRESRRGEPEVGSDRRAPGARLGASLRNALAVASILEQRLGERVRWDTRSFEVSLNDRLSAPHGDATRLAWRPEVEAVARTLYPEGEPRVSDRGEDPRERVGFRVEASATLAVGPAAEPIETLLARLGEGRTE